MNLFLKLGVVVLLTSVLNLQLVLAQTSGAAKPVKTECIAQKDLQDIAKHFTQFTNLAGKDFCNDQSQDWFLLSSMMFMKRTAFDANMMKSKDELFTGKFAKDWYDYFIGRISDIEVVSSCPKGAVAYVRSFGGKTMYVCPLALKDSLSSLDRASVFMHEARHIDGYPHITCTKGPRAGISGACDKKISDTGSYAVTVETYAQLAKYASGLNPALKAYARSSAVIYADEAFETPVQINRKDQLMMLTENLNFNLLDAPARRTTILGKAPVAGRIFKRAQHMVLIPTDKTLPARYVFAKNAGEINQSPAEIISEYNAQPVSEKEKLVDIHSGSQFSIRVYKTALKFVCDPKSPAITDINLPVGMEAASLIYPNGYDRAAKNAFLVSKNSNIFEVGCQGTKAYVKNAVIRFDQKFSRMYKIAGLVYGLGLNGQLFDATLARSTPLNFNLDSKIIEIMPYQTYEFFDTP